MKRMTGKEIFEELQSVYKDESPSKSFVYKWIGEFQRGRTSVLTEHHGGRPNEIGDEKQEALAAIVRDERRITIRDLADRLHVSYGSCQQILKSLGIRKLSSRFVPRFLTAEMMTNRVQCCMKQIHLHEQYGDQFRLNILTEDETPRAL